MPQAAPSGLLHCSPHSVLSVGLCTVASTTKATTVPRVGFATNKIADYQIDFSVSSESFVSP